MQARLRAEERRPSDFVHGGFCFKQFEFSTSAQKRSQREKEENVQRSTLNVQLSEIGCSALDVERWAFKPSPPCNLPLLIGIAASVIQKIDSNDKLLRLAWWTLASNRFRPRDRNPDPTPWNST